jgi:hypothetical protein
MRWNEERYAGGGLHSLFWQARSDKRRSLFFSLGEERALVATELPLLKTAVDGLKEAPPTDVAPVHLEIHPKAFVAPLMLMHMLYNEPKREGPLVESLAKGDFSGMVDDLVRFTETPEGKKVLADFNKAFPRPDDDAARMRIRVTGGSALGLRVELHPEALRLIPLFAYGPE